MKGPLGPYFASLNKINQSIFVRETIIWMYEQIFIKTVNSHGFVKYLLNQSFNKIDLGFFSRHVRVLVNAFRILIEYNTYMIRNHVYFV